jgi:hypothetical protein
MWECEGAGETLREGQLKIGVTKLTAMREIPVPVVITEQRVGFAILCAKSVCKSDTWNKWADNWIDGSDRSMSAARAARAEWAEAAEWAEWAVATAAAEWAVAAATAAARARATAAATAAAWATAAAAAAEGNGIDLAATAEEACK